MVENEQHLQKFLQCPNNATVELWGGTTSWESCGGGEYSHSGRGKYQGLCLRNTAFLSLGPGEKESGPAGRGTVRGGVAAVAEEMWKISKNLKRISKNMKDCDQRFNVLFRHGFETQDCKQEYSSAW